MLVFGSQMHIATFLFTVLELIALGYQLFHYLSWPEDKGRMWYLILIILLILYNITGGLFPDPRIGIPIMIQNIVAYGTGFIMGSYFPFYFYKGFDLKTLRFHAIYGVPVFLLLPYVLFFVIGYPIFKDLDLIVSYGIVIPFFYALVLLAAISKAIHKRYKECKKENKFLEEVAVYAAIIPWASMPALSYFHASQFIEVMFTNTGFVIITAIFMSKSAKTNRMAKQAPAVQLIDLNREALFEDNCQRLELTPTQIIVASMICKGATNKEIAEEMRVSEETVKKHVANTFRKADCRNRAGLIHKLVNN